MYEQVRASSGDPTVQAGIFPNYLPVILTFVRHLITDFLLSAINSRFQSIAKSFSSAPIQNRPKIIHPFYLLLNMHNFHLEIM